MRKSPKPLELSTGHLSMSTRVWLDYPARRPIHLPMRGHEEGWTITTAPATEAQRALRQAEAPGSLPPDLELCLRWGLARGAEWVLFDCEVDLRAYLPAYDETDTICLGECGYDAAYKGPRRWLAGIPRDAIVTWQGSPAQGWPEGHKGLEAIDPARIRDEGLRPRCR